MTAARAAGLAVAAAIVIGAPALAHAQLTANAPNISVSPGATTMGMVIVDNQTGGAVTISDFTHVGGMCGTPDPFGTPAPLPHTIPNNTSFTFAIGVGPFATTGSFTCVYDVVNSAAVPTQVTVTVMTGPITDPGSGIDIEPNGLAFGAVAPGATVNRTIATITQDPAGGTNSPTFQFSGAPMFEMVSPCSTTLPSSSCQGGTLGPTTPITNAMVRCAPAAATPRGWYVGQLTVRGWMTMLDSIELSCDVRTGGGGPTPDAAPGTPDANPNQPDADPNQPDADPNRPDADPFAPDARPGGNPGTGVTDYYACGCDGSTGATGALLILIVFVTARRGR